MVKIGLDAGHGLNTVGKQTPNGIKEWSLNDEVRDKVIALLSEYDVEIINTDNNEGNIDESLSARLNSYLKAGVAAFVSIHHNAFTGSWNEATGVEVYVDNNATDQDMRLAELIYNKLVSYTGLRARGIKRAAFTVINQNKIPAVLCEGGFMDSANDYKIITSVKGQEAYARAVAEGLIEFLNLQKKQNKSIIELANEVIKGLWGNGDERRQRLALAGYDYNAVQSEVNSILGASSIYFKKSGKNYNSIVEALKSIGAESGFAYRRKIAAKNGIKNYFGTASQNIKMLNLLKEGKLIKP